MKCSICCPLKTLRLEINVSEIYIETIKGLYLWQLFRPLWSQAPGRDQVISDHCSQVWLLKDPSEYSSCWSAFLSNWYKEKLSSTSLDVTASPAPTPGYLHLEALSHLEFGIIITSQPPVKYCHRYNELQSKIRPGFITPPLHVAGWGEEKNDDYEKRHMGQSLQDGENACFVSFFFWKVEPSCDKTWYSRVHFSIVSSKLGLVHQKITSWPSVMIFLSTLQGPCFSHIFRILRYV